MNESMLEKFFSVKNDGNHKVITIFGVKIKIKRKRFNLIAPVKLDIRLEQKINLNCCPLCEHEKYFTLMEYDVNQIIVEWERLLSINPVADVYKNEILQKHKCLNCGMIYFNYRFPDTQELYETLALHNWYYPEYKWDYEIALNLLKEFKPDSLLEIGAGKGYFLKKVQGGDQKNPWYRV